MKKTKILCILMALILLPLLGVAEAAKEKPRELFGTALMDAQEDIRSMAVVDDTAYMLSFKSLYRYRAGDEMPKMIASFSGIYLPEYSEDLRPSILLSVDGQLMGLGRDGQLFPMLIEGDTLKYGEVTQLDWSIYRSDEEEGFYDAPEYYTLMDGKLYAKLGNYGGELKNDLHCFDLKTGDVKAFASRFLNGLVPYKDGKLIGIYYDQNAGEMVGDEYVQMTPQVQVFDPQADRSEPIPLILPGAKPYEKSQSNLYYDEATDRIYAMNSDGLWRLSDKEEPVLVSRMPTAGGWSNRGRGPALSPWKDGLLFAAYGSNAYLHGTDENDLPPVTTLSADFNFMDERSMTRALMRNPDLTIKRYEDKPWLDPETMLTMFLSGEMSLDILSMDSSSHDLQRLMQKGYLLDLSQNEALKAIGEDSFDAMRPLMYHEDKLFLLPFGVFTSLPYAYSKGFQEIGREIPGTLQELLDLVKWWAEEGHIAHEGYRLFDYGGVKQTLIYLINQVYVDSVLGEGKPLQYDMEVFGGFMRQLEEIDLRDIEPSPDEIEMMGNGGGNGDGTEFLITAAGGYYLDEASVGIAMVPMPLSVDKNAHAWHKANVLVFGIPATARHPEEAMRFLSAYMENLPDRDKWFLSRSLAGPIPNPRYEESLTELEDLVALYHAQIAKEEDGPKKREIEESAAMYEKDLERFKEKGKYSLTAETLARHKDFMKTVYVNDSLTMVLSKALIDKEGNNMLNMYGEGAISLEQFIQQANDKIRLMTLEQK